MADRRAVPDEVEIHTSPREPVTDPTLGIDVGSRVQIYEALHWMADQGAGLLMVSTDADEISSQCDRILVFRRGRLIAAGFSLFVFAALMAIVVIVVNIGAR